MPDDPIPPKPPGWKPGDPEPQPKPPAPGAPEYVPPKTKP